MILTYDFNALLPLIFCDLYLISRVEQYNINNTSSNRTTASSTADNNNLE